MYDAKGRVIEITDAGGNTYVHNEYDAGNRVTRQRLLGGQEYILLYADHERTNTYLAPANGKQIRYIYNKKKQLIRTEYPDQTTEEYAYDDWENRIMEKDRLGNETRRTYDESGNLLEEHFPHGLVCSYEYDPEGNCTSSRDNGGRQSLFVYDARGNLTKEIQQITDSLQREVSYEYDQYGRVTAFTDGNGNRETYRYTGKFWEAESFTTAGGSRYRHTLDGAGRCVELENADGVSSFAYNNYDILCMETDPLGLTTRYIYSRTTDLMRVIRPNHYAPEGGQEPAEHFTYDAFHNRLSRTDETGAVFAMHRDGEGNITKEINPNFYHPGEKDGTGIEYRYDADDRLCLSIYPDGGKERRWYDAAGNLTGLCRPEQYHEKEDTGEGFSYEYDAANRLVQITGPDGKIRKRYVYDLHGNICKVIGAKGMETGETDEERIGELYTYNYAGWLMESRIPVRVEDGKALYRLTRYRYDKVGNRTEEKRYNDYQTKESAAGTVLIIRYEYDKDDRLIKVTDSTGAVLEYGYDSQNRRVSESRKISDTACQTFRYRYDAAGRMMELHRTADREGSGRRSVMVRYEYDRNGNMTRTILPSGAEILREYDPADRLVTEIHVDPDSGIHNTTRFAYDKAGNLTCITDNQGRNTRIEYDAMNREIKRTEKDGSVTRNFYDRNGQLVKTIRPNAYAEHKDEGAGYAYTYDAEGRIVTVIRPDGTIQESSVYDGEGNLIQTTDAAGSRVRYTYDFGGRQTEIRTGGQASQKYVYDAAGNITGIEDGAGNHTGYALDAWGRIVEIRKADGSSEYYRYDCAGNIVQSTDGEGNATVYEYNGINRLASVTDPMGGQETYAYDAEERLCKKTDRNGTETRYTYNIYGNLLTRTAGELSERYEYTPEGLLKSAISGGMRYSYTYDAMNRLREKCASGRRLLAFVYDKNGNLTAQEDVTGKVTEYRYNLLDQVTEVWDSGKRLAAYTYNPDGTVRSIKNGNSLYTEYAYDADKNLTGLLTKLGDDTIVENHYRYDGNGNRIEKQQKHGITAYTYDRLNQLVEVNYPDRTETLFYDKAGNRTGRVAGSAEERYYYDKRNRLTAQEKNGVHTEFQYDAAGNLVRDDKAAYTYDAFNRNTRVETFDGNIQINRYDAEGLRHEMEENGKLVQFIFRGTEVVAEETQEEKIRYIRAGELLASDAESARTYYHYASDEMGSITHVTAGNAVLNRYEYDAWGNAKVCEEQVANRFRFNGQQYDPVSQQYYLRARFYNPVIARFTQEDTYRGDGLNLYAYCKNNPVYYVDPSGHICDPAAQKIMEKLASNQATRNEQKKLAAYLRNKDRHGGLTDAERGALQQVDSYTYLPRYENQTLPWQNIEESVTRESGRALKGDIQQVEYGSTDLSQKAIEYRKEHNITGARNVAVFEYENNGQLNTVVGASQRNQGHAERLVAKELENMGIQSTQVRRIYSELEPCSIPGGYCKRFLANVFPQADVTYSFEYGLTQQSRGAGVKALKESIKKIFD